MSDLRLVQCLPSCEVDHDRMVPTHHRPVTRAEVLEALGAWKLWLCSFNTEPCWANERHAECGWRWVVTDAT